MFRVTGFLAAVLLSGSVFAQNCELTIDSTDQMKYDKDSLTVSSECSEVTLTLTHSGQMSVQQMGHNWVLAESGDVQGIAQDGISAGLDNEYLKPGDERVIAATEQIGGGESTTITFSLEGLEPGGDYEFFCSFPGHVALMRGDFIIE
ncbi:MAG: azurin [Gammaproteobacteria bacterium]|nr:azurin [Gammaproteobacteria bacterium]